jgi:RHS repeat-associated protein
MLKLRYQFHNYELAERLLKNWEYDGENRLTGVSGGASATFVYDGDGNRVKGTTSAGTTIYIGNHFEYTTGNGQMKSYYYAGGERIAMRDNGTVKYLLSDHLGSNAVVADTSGVRTSEVRYKAWGEDRYSYGTSPTSYRYTGQRVEQSIGLYFYGARWYDSALGRFTSPDSIIPAQQGVMGNDRYAAMNNNPLRYNDPSGHCILICSLLGAAAGAIAGGIIYASTTAISGREWNNGDFLASVGVGAVGGALVGTGIGAAAGIATFAAIGAGTGVIGGEFGYSVTAGASFDSGDMAIASAASGIAGGITGAVGASSIAGSMTGFGINMLANGGASAGQYVATQLSNDQPVNPALAFESGIIGAAVGGINDTFVGGSQYAEYAQRWMTVANNPATRSSLSNASKMAIGGLIVYSPEQVARSAVTEVISNYWQKQWSMEQ